MFSSNNPFSFEQVYAQLNYVEYSTAASAIDELVDEHTIHHRPVDVTSETGAKYIVRVYNSVNYPTHDAYIFVGSAGRPCVRAPLTPSRPLIILHHD